jgi:hypothetical protein
MTLLAESGDAEPDVDRFTWHMGNEQTIRDRVGEVVIDRRFNGPPASANGGYACGVIARFIDGPARVVLRSPPPLATPLAVCAGEDGRVVVLHGDTLVAEAGPSTGPFLEPPVRPSLAEAVAARRRHPLRDVRHLLSDCVVCGPHRDDGLGVTPGLVAGTGHVLAAPFIPDRSVSRDGEIVDRAVVWAAIDCTSFPAELLDERRVALLGTFEVRVERDVEVGERLVVVGWTRTRHGRKYLTASALLAEDGSTVAKALAIWVPLEGGGLR